MLIVSVISIAIAIVGMGLTNFLNSDRKEAEVSDLPIRNMVVGIAFASVVIIVMKLIVKLYKNEEIKEGLSIAKQYKKKKSKSKSKQKKCYNQKKEKLLVYLKREKL
ncbi:oligosaccharide flippase family protein [Ehrlichia sp. JZT12]